MKYTVSFSSRTVALPARRITTSKIVEFTSYASGAKDALRDVFPDAFYSYTIRPDCIVFYDPTFGKIYVKS